MPGQGSGEGQNTRIIIFVTLAGLLALLALLCAIGYRQNRLKAQAEAGERGLQQPRWYGVAASQPNLWLAVHPASRLLILCTTTCIAAARRALEAEAGDGSSGGAKPAAAAVEVYARAVVVLMPDEQVLCGLPVEEAAGTGGAPTDADRVEGADAGSSAHGVEAAAAATAATAAAQVDGSFAASNRIES